MRKDLDILFERLTSNLVIGIELYERLSDADKKIFDEACTEYVKKRKNEIRSKNRRR